MRQMTPDLLLHPVFDEAEALAGMPHRKVVHPSPEHRIDQVYHPFNRLPTGVGGTIVGELAAIDVDIDPTLTGFSTGEIDVILSSADQRAVPVSAQGYACGIQGGS
jgi:hypothetical protein